MLNLYYKHYGMNVETIYRKALHSLYFAGRLYPLLTLLMLLHMEFQPIIPCVAVINKKLEIPLMRTLGVVLILL